MKHTYSTRIVAFTQWTAVVIMHETILTKYFTVNSGTLDYKI